MTTNSVEQLQALRAKLTEIEKKVTEVRQKEFASLSQQYGFKTTSEFIAAVQKASGVRRGRAPGKNSATKPKGRGRRQRRARITHEMRAQVKTMSRAGKTGGEIATALSISPASVQNIKKAFGLVKKRKVVG